VEFSFQVGKCRVSSVLRYIQSLLSLRGVVCFYLGLFCFISCTGMSIGAELVLGLRTTLVSHFNLGIYCKELASGGCGISSSLVGSILWAALSVALSACLVSDRKSRLRWNSAWQRGGGLYVWELIAVHSSASCCFDLFQHHLHNGQVNGRLVLAARPSTTEFLVHDLGTY